MATIVRGTTDDIVTALQSALEALERDRPGAEASLYRSNPGSVRVRVIDRRFEGTTRSHRHDEVWSYLRSRAGEDAMTEVSQLLLFAPAELGGSLANLEFEDPVETPH